MNRICAILVVVSCFAGCRKPIEFPRLVNYDESKAGSAVPIDPLIRADGRKIASAAEWPERRREILALLEREEYGVWPAKPEEMVIDQTSDMPVFFKTARRKLYSMYFRKDRSGPRVDWMLVTPTDMKGPVPVIVMLNYGGNQELFDDAYVPIMDAWVPSKSHRKDESSRGKQRWPIDMVVARGYALLTACYQQIATDASINDMTTEEIRQRGCYQLWPKSQDTGALMAWGWGVARGLDLAERIPGLDAKRAVAFGCSRLGKAALLAGAYDERFKVVVPCETGGAGVPLQKHNFGENAYWMTRVFPYWFGSGYFKYDSNEEAMPFDQHFLLAAVAPRHLLVESFEENWYDPKGEFLSCRAASPVWEFLGYPGLPAGGYPQTLSTDRVGPRLGYVRRAGWHGLSGHDWKWMLDFADQAL